MTTSTARADWIGISSWNRQVRGGTYGGWVGCDAGRRWRGPGPRAEGVLQRLRVVLTMALIIIESCRIDSDSSIKVVSRTSSASVAPLQRQIQLRPIRAWPSVALIRNRDVPRQVLSSGLPPCTRPR